jgi:hypothetical protein
LLFRHKNENEPRNKLQVNLGDLQTEKENLTKYLESHLKVEVFEVKDKLAVGSEKVTISGLHHAVKKFLYSRGHNMTHWISLEGSTVKINRFGTHNKKKEKHEKQSSHQTVAQSWGL